MKTRYCSVFFTTFFALSAISTIFGGCSTNKPEQAPTPVPLTPQDQKALEIIKNRPPRPPRGNKAEGGTAGR